MDGNIDADAGSLAGLQVNMLATFADWEREIIRERIADMRGTIKARGERSAGRVPLGYRTDPATKQLVIDEKPAVTVRWFFREAAKGTTTNDLVKKANRKKLAARNWSSRTVLRLLTNHTYAGHRPDGAPGRHAPLVSAELFSKVQALIDGRRTRTPTKPIQPHRGRLQPPGEVAVGDEEDGSGPAPVKGRGLGYVVAGAAGSGTATGSGSVSECEEDTLV